MTSAQGRLGIADLKRDTSYTRDSLHDIQQVLHSKYQHYDYANSNSQKNELSPFLKPSELKQHQFVNSDEEIGDYVDGKLGVVKHGKDGKGAKKDKSSNASKDQSQ